MGTLQPTPQINPPSDPKSLASDFFDFLQQFQAFENAPYVHPKAISFNDASHRANWNPSIPDAPHRDTLPQFYNAKKNGKKCWVGFFSGETANWVDTPNWQDEPWHCFTIAIIQDPVEGKHMVVIDPDPSPDAKPGQRATTILKGLQRNLFLWIRKHKTKSLRLWYSIDQSHAGQELCLLHSLRMVQTLAAVGDSYWQGLDDPRTKNCIEITDV